MFFNRITLGSLEEGCAADSNERGLRETSRAKGEATNQGLAVLSSQASPQKAALRLGYSTIGVSGDGYRRLHLAGNYVSCFCNLQEESVFTRRRYFQN